MLQGCFHENNDHSYTHCRRIITVALPFSSPLQLLRKLKLGKFSDIQTQYHMLIQEFVQELETEDLSEVIQINHLNTAYNDIDRLNIEKKMDAALFPTFLNTQCRHH